LTAGPETRQLGRVHFRRLNWYDAWVALIETYDANKNVTSETTGGVMASYTWAKKGSGVFRSFSDPEK